MSDKFANEADEVVAPARRCFVINPHNTERLAVLPKAIRAPSDGVITLRAIDADADVAHPVRAGEVLNVRVSFVRAAGTNVSGPIIGYA